MIEKHYAHLSPNYVAETVRAALPSLGIMDKTNVATLAARQKQRIGHQSSIGCDNRPLKLERQFAVEIEPENLTTRFTRRIRHDSLIRSRITS
jgi:hypothetical protein